MKKVALPFSIVFLFVLATHAHPEHAAGDHGHEHDPVANEPTAAQKTKRLERVVRRAEARSRNREQRSADRRRHLRNRVTRHLLGASLTPSLVAVLSAHAEQTATLRQIRYLAAMSDDYDSVVRADKVLAKLNSEHERWWRTVVREARKK